MTLGVQTLLFEMKTYVYIKYKNANVKYLMIKINSSFQHISKKIYYPIQVKVVVVETWFFMSTDIATIST